MGFSNAKFRSFHLILANVLHFYMCLSSLWLRLGVLKKKMETMAGVVSRAVNRIRATLARFLDAASVTSHDSDRGCSTKQGSVHFADPYSMYY